MQAQADPTTSLFTVQVMAASRRRREGSSYAPVGPKKHAATPATAGPATQHRAARLLASDAEVLQLGLQADSCTTCALRLHSAEAITLTWRLGGWMGLCTVPLFRNLRTCMREGVALAPSIAVIPGCARVRMYHICWPHTPPPKSFSGPGRRPVQSNHAHVPHMARIFQPLWPTADLFFVD